MRKSFFQLRRAASLCAWGIVISLRMRVVSSLISPLVGGRIVKIEESIWREAALQHVASIQTLLEPGLTDPRDVVNSGRHRSGPKRQLPHNMTSLDPKNPVYNFLIEYYGLKGGKGPKRLARWSPDPALLLMNDMHRADSLRIEEEGCDGILLEGATELDLGGTLHLKGAIPYKDGIVYSPMAFYRGSSGGQASDSKLEKAAAPFLWYRSVLANTLNAEPVTHCHGLHEWAMQYQPDGAPPPPSAKYQAHLSRRVSRQVINAAVERRGISCTHVDALRYFSPAAGPLNHHGAVLKRTDQLRLEQPACVHAHMDLLKISLRLMPFIDASLVTRCLEIALEARKLDVAASPYDASDYGVGVVPIETSAGRRQYRERQAQLMKRAEPIRRDLLDAYNVFLSLAFDDSTLKLAHDNPSSERFAKAEPGGLPWRKNLLQTEDASAT